MKELLDGILIRLLMIAALVLAGYYLVKRLFIDKDSIVPSAGEVANSAKAIIAYGPGAVLSALKGESEVGYISQEQAKAAAAAALARKQALQEA